MLKQAGEKGHFGGEEVTVDLKDLAGPAGVQCQQRQGGVVGCLIALAVH